MQNHIEGVGAYRMPADLARAVLDEPRVYAANFAGLPGTLPQESYSRAPDVYVTNAFGTFEPCGCDSYVLVI